MKSEKRVHVVVLGTSDVHGDLLGFSYEDNAPSPNSGLARFVTYVEKVRSEVGSVILLDAGDALQGNILTDSIALEKTEGVHPVIAAMNALGYDAMTLGNHEFNWGVSRLLSILKDANFPVLAANIRKKDGSLLTCFSHQIIEKEGIRIGIIGVVTPDIPFWDGANPEIAACTFLPAPEAVRTEIESLKDKTDVIIVSAHLGMEPEFPPAKGGDSGYCILEKNPEVDVLQVGHCHITTHGEIGTSLYGGCLNDAMEAVRFDLYFENRKLVEKTVSIVSMKDYEPSRALMELPEVKEAHEKTVAFASGTDEGSTLGSTVTKFQPENTYSGVPEAFLRNTPLPDFINCVMKEATKADVAAVPLFKLTSDLPEGKLFYKDVFGIYKFSNVLCRLRLSGRELKKWLEWNATFYQVEEKTVSFKEDYPYYAYDFFLGVDYTIDLGKPEGERIQKATIKGVPLEEVESLTLAVAHYRYTSLVKGKGIAEATLEWEAPHSVRDYIVAYMGKHSPLDPKTFLSDNWHLVGYEGKEFTPKGLFQH